MYLIKPQNPVTQAYGGGDAINVRELSNFCGSVSSNMSMIEQELQYLKAAFTEQQNRLTKTHQFIDWLQTTNPGVLNEFRATAKVLGHLDGGNERDEVQTSPGP